VFSLPLLPGDVVIMGSDGLLDNMYEEELVALAPADATQVAAAAAAMADLALRNSSDPDYDSPYAREAVQEGIDLPIWQKASGVGAVCGGGCLCMWRGEEQAAVPAGVEAAALRLQLWLLSGLLYTLTLTHTHPFHLAVAQELL
jgi:hypothetical protein